MPEQTRPDPTDLIRAMDDALAGSDDASVSVSRTFLQGVRDALDASDAELDGVGQALALANIRIERVRETCRKALAVKVAGSTEGEAAAAAIATCILRAIEEE